MNGAVDRRVVERVQPFDLVEHSMAEHSIYDSPHTGMHTAMPCYVHLVELAVLQVLDRLMQNVRAVLIGEHTLQCKALIAGQMRCVHLLRQPCRQHLPAEEEEDV